MIESKSKWQLKSNLLQSVIPIITEGFEKG